MIKVKSSGGTNTTDANATAAQILAGKTAYVNGVKVTGTIPSKSAATIMPSTANHTIAAGQYLSGAQTIAGDADLKATNIKAGVNIFGVTGTYTSPSSLPKLSYTGEMVSCIKNMDGKTYALFILESSGTLTVTGSYTGDVFLCGGGSGGKMGVSTIGYYSGAGGGGGYTFNKSNISITSGNVIIGAGGKQDEDGGTTSYLSYQAAGGIVSNSSNDGTGGNGGSGGGAGLKNIASYDGGDIPYKAGVGQGTSTRPFLSQDMAPCGAGGGGFRGGRGGTDGSDGYAQLDVYDGGYKGGGMGDFNAYSGTYYGAGGGGCNQGGSYSTTAAGDGFAGVVMIRIPI